MFFCELWYNERITYKVAKSTLTINHRLFQLDQFKGMILLLLHRTLYMKQSITRHVESMGLV